MVERLPRVPVTTRPVSANDPDALVSQAQRGDRRAFQALFLRHRSDVTRLVHRMMGHGGDIEDLVQEVFFQVFRSIGDFRGDSKFSTWLHRITVNVVLMARRAAKSRPVFSAEVSDASPHLMPIDSGLAPDEDAHRRLRLQAFQRCIDKLTDKKRTVFILHELEGMPAADISRVVEAPVLTVRTRLFYARKELCELMREEPTLVGLADQMAKARENNESNEPSQAVEQSDSNENEDGQ